ncbi:isochorismatase family protein [Neobacillus sp. D3-1R]|uniref:isochorismatase family protein n=1 Tax=Neobacillus sp. D3-1R TaxID=3445778 RepID=UPI003F9F9F39
MQNEFFEDESSKKSLEEILGVVNFSINVFRDAQQPIIFIQDEDAGEGPESYGYQLAEGLHAEDTDYYVSKQFSNSFWQTSLEEKLRELNVGMVLICGFAAEYCVQATYQGALERGFEPALLQHGIASMDQRYIGFVQEINRTASIKVVQYLFNNK